MLDPPTHNRPFADKRDQGPFWRDKVGMDGVPYLYDLDSIHFEQRHFRRVCAESHKVDILPLLKSLSNSGITILL